MPGSYEQKFAGLRQLLGYQMSHPGKKLLFMGGEFGQFIEWKDQEQLDWLLLDYESHQRMLAYTAALNKLYLAEKALWELDHDLEGYQWIDADDSGQSIVSYIRRGKRPVDTLLIIINFQPVERRHYRIGVPRPGVYEELFSSETLEYGGSGFHNEPLKSTKTEWHNQVNSVELTLPPLGFLVLKKTGRKTV
ncbi:alpha amylase C-terminal domain-containing protein [Paenibacillus rhizoplanae]